MHPRIREVLDRLDAQRAVLERAVEEVPVALRDRSPEPERWSVAEVLEHLALVEERITQLVAREAAAARAGGLGAERESSPVVPTLDLTRLLDRSRPLTASAAAQPRGRAVAAAAWRRLEQARHGTREALLSLDGLALADVTAAHPVLGTINLYQWVLFLAGHEARHTAQIREIGAAIASA